MILNLMIIEARVEAILSFHLTGSCSDNSFSDLIAGLLRRVAVSE